MRKPHIPRGVIFKNGKYIARIQVRGSTRITIGLFDSAEQASDAYEKAKSDARLLLPSVNPPELTRSRLRSLVDYNPVTGVFTRIADNLGLRGRYSVGDAVGNVHPIDGYVRFRIDGRRYLAHRLAWLYMTGEIPKGQIDHIDGDRSNNRFNNLRVASRHENQQNTPIQTKSKRSVSGLKGSHWHKSSGKFAAEISSYGKRYHLGYFRTAEEAHAAYLKAKKSLHLYQPSHTH